MYSLKRKRWFHRFIRYIPVGPLFSYDMAHPSVEDGEDDCQMWKVTPSILDKQLQTSNKW